MDKKSKILLWILILAAIVSVGITFYKTIIKKDYLISEQISCNPQIESCFVSRCDPTIDEGCELDESTTYYKIIEKKAANILLCDPNSESCSELTCGLDEGDCTITLCKPENKDGLECSGN